MPLATPRPIGKLRRASYKKRESAQVKSMGKGKGKVEMKRIEKASSRHTAFWRRKREILEKAHELTILCDAQVGVLVFSNSGNLFEYFSPSSSMNQIMERYRGVADVENSEASEQLKACMRRLSCEEFANVNLDELCQIEEQLNSSLGKVHARKSELLKDQLQELRREKNMLKEVNKELLGDNQPQGLPTSPVHEQPRELMRLLPSHEPHSPPADRQPAISGSNLRLAID